MTAQRKEAQRLRADGLSWAIAKRLGVTPPPARRWALGLHGQGGKRKDGRTCSKLMP